MLWCRMLLLSIGCLSRMLLLLLMMMLVMLTVADTRDCSIIVSCVAGLQLATIGPSIRLFHGWKSAPERFQFNCMFCVQKYTNIIM